jgi:hypothetical protein
MAVTAINRVCYLFSSFLPPLKIKIKNVACVGAARVEDPIRPSRVCRGFGRPNPTGQSELRSRSMSQSDLGNGVESWWWRGGWF